MAVTLTPQTGTTVVPEYAAMSSTTTRSVVNQDGLMVPVFAGTISYRRTDYLVDAQGNKVGVVTAQPQPFPGGVEDDAYGVVSLTPEQLAAHLEADQELAMAFAKIADFEDGLIRDHLVARGIL